LGLYRIKLDGPGEVSNNILYRVYFGEVPKNPAKPVVRASYAEVLNHRALCRLMDLANQSTRTLAQRVEELGERDDPPVSCSSSLIGHLRTGHTRSTNIARAQLIEHILRVRHGALFRYAEKRPAVARSRAA
jgi:hypothetical protein